MILVTILEVTSSDSGTANANAQGTSTVVFYTANDAIKYAIAMSEQVVFGSSNSDLQSLTVYYNTDTEERRWWFRGTEYTG